MAHRCISLNAAYRFFGETRLKSLCCHCPRYRCSSAKHTPTLYPFTRSDQESSKQKAHSSNICKYHQREQLKEKYCSIYFKTNNLQCLNSPLSSHILYNSVVYIPHYSLHSNLQSSRSFHSTVKYLKEESIPEKSVKVLKESQKERAPDDTKKDLPQDKIVAEKTETKVSVEPEKTILQRAKSLGVKIWAEVKHYWNGLKLFYVDIKICGRLIWKWIWHGHMLTRRERKQLIRTTADLFRLVPFLIFIIVPMMEFLLPFALKIFPNMLPSTFRVEAKEQEKVKKQLKMKLEIAKFLQDTTEEMPVLFKKKHKIRIAEEFSEFIIKARSEGIPVSTEDILKFSKLFEDEITLDSLDRKTLRALCQVLSIPLTNVTGTFDGMLRFQLMLKLRQLLADDKMIEKEGVDSLAIWELQSACRARGMRALGVPEERLKFQLQQWLDLRLNHEIPTSLLLLSRTLYLPEEISTEERLKTIISTLPETTTTQAKIMAAEITGEKVDNKEKLELIKSEEMAIKKEMEEKAAEKEEAETKEREKAEKEEAERIEKEKLELIQEAVAAESAMSVTSKEELPDTALELESKPAEELKTPEQEEEERITSKDLEEIESALEDIAEEKHLNIDKEELEDLKEDVSEYKENIEDLKSVIIAQGGDENLVESKAAKRLTKRVDRLIAQVHSIVDELHVEKEQIQEEIEIGEVKMKRNQELLGDEVKRKAMIEALSEKKGNVISINEMVLALKRLQKVPDDDKLQKIVQVLDEDKDGNIDITHVLKVIELLGRENVKLSRSQITEVINLLKQEHILEEEEKLKEKLEKESEKNNINNKENIEKQQQAQ